MTRDWFSLLLVGLLLGGIFAAIAVKAIRDRVAAHRAHVLALIAEAKRLESVYDPYLAQCMVDDLEYIANENQAMHLANDEPCWHEDNWCTGECLEPPRGRHHVVHTLTDLPEPDDPWWTR